jgi:hypothetical protein
VVARRFEVAEHAISAPGTHFASGWGVATAPLIGVAAASALALPGIVQVGDQTLAAASCGTRETLWIDHYAASLYVRPGDSPEHALLDPRRAKALEVRLINKTFMPAEIPRKYRRALEVELGDEAMEQVRDAYRALRSGDVVRIAYLPALGVSVSVNGQRIAAAPTHGAIQAILVAWAGDKPVRQHLRAMLARHPCAAPITG